MGKPDVLPGTEFLNGLGKTFCMEPPGLLFAY
jgi:hypothetical protein